MLNDYKRIIVDYVSSGLPDLTNRQMGILLTVYCENGPHTVRGLAAALNISKPVVTRALNKLDQLRYVRRVPDHNDRRSVFIVQTEPGREFLGSVRQMAGKGELIIEEIPRQRMLVRVA